jgi:hypothetical protein
MLSFKLLAAAIIQLVRAQQVQPLEYVNINVGEGGLFFVHPEVPAGIGDGVCSCFFCFLLQGAFCVSNLEFLRPVLPLTSQSTRSPALGMNC